MKENLDIDSRKYYDPILGRYSKHYGNQTVYPNYNEFVEDDKIILRQTSELKTDQDGDLYKNRLDKYSEELLSLIKEIPRLFNNKNVKKVSKTVLGDLVMFCLEFLENVDDISFAEKFFIMCSVIPSTPTDIFFKLPIMYQDIAISEAMKYKPSFSNESMDIIVDEEFISLFDSTTEGPLF